MDLSNLLSKHGFPASVLPIIAEKPWQIKTVSQLANSFDEPKEIRTGLFEAVEAWKNEGAILIGFKVAWKEAHAADAMSLKRAQDGLDEENISTIHYAWKSRRLSMNFG